MTDEPVKVYEKVRAPNITTGVNVQNSSLWILFETFSTKTKGILVLFYNPGCNYHTAETKGSWYSGCQRANGTKGANNGNIDVNGYGHCFLYAHRIIYIDHLEHAKTIPVVYYVSLLDRLNDKIKYNRPSLKRKEIRFTIDKYTDSSFSHYSGKNQRISVQIAYLSTVFARSDLLRFPPLSCP